VLAVAAAVAHSARAQEPKQFPAEAAAITVDVVVVDDKGQPVRGLVAADFTVLDQGRTKPITAFAARERPDADTASTSSVAPSARRGIAGNTAPESALGGTHGAIPMRLASYLQGLPESRRSAPSSATSPRERWAR
jgi:hypothetical protein